jgi:hypothetical protein
MKKAFSPFLLTAISLLVVCCGTQNPGSASTREEMTSKVAQEAGSAVFPRVISSGWHRLGDSTPEMDVTGFSRITYQKNDAPKDVVEVYYHGMDGSQITTDDKSSVTIMGKKVQTYDSGNEDPAFATQPFLLTAPNGKSSYYSFQFNNANLYKTRAIPQFGW